MASCYFSLDGVGVMLLDAGSENHRHGEMPCAYTDGMRNSGARVVGDGAAVS